MKSVYLISTLLFWLAVAAVWGISAWRRDGRQTSNEITEPRYRLEAVAAHNRAGDCWMAIGGEVYDLTEYLPKHPTSPAVIVPWCGKEATVAYNTKNRGRPHSAYASEQLTKYRIGKLTD